jgi:hypothetical protein
MDKLRLLAAAPVLWLALAAASPDPGETATAQAECRMPHDEALAALRGFPVMHSEDRAAAPARNVHNLYVLPKGMTAFGTLSDELSAIDERDDGGEQLTIMATVSKPYEQVVPTALQAKGAKACLARDEGERASCLIEMRDVGGWTVGLAIVRYGSDTGVVCGYTRKGP